MSAHPIPQQELIKLVYTRLLTGLLIMILILFLPAGTLAYWQAWLYLGCLVIPMLIVLNFWLRKDPELLERRMRMREKEVAQKKIIRVSYFIFPLFFLLPGFDYRFGWSSVPVWLVIIADCIVLIGYGLFVLTIRENRFASRIIEVQNGQRVITTGPYSLVRHPMYLGVMLIYFLTPLALGSYWALLSSIWIVPILAARIINEEKVLERDLPGYLEYQQKTRFRIIPGIW